MTYEHRSQSNFWAECTIKFHFHFLECTKYIYSVVHSWELHSIKIHVTTIINTYNFSLLLIFVISFSSSAILPINPPSRRGSTHQKKPHPFGSWTTGQGFLLERSKLSCFGELQKFWVNLPYSLASKEPSSRILIGEWSPHHGRNPTVAKN